MCKYFAKEGDCLFNLKDMDCLKPGDIFFKSVSFDNCLILQKYEFLDKEYLNSIIDKLSEIEIYDYQVLLEKKL